MNTNYLIGMKCPECGSEGPFRIDATITVTIHDDGREENFSETTWKNDSWCCCEAWDCGFVGVVADFKEQETKQ